MATDPSRSGKIILTSTALNGDALALVCYPDGSCCITRDGKKISDSFSSPCDIREATQLLLKLSQLD